MVKRVGHGTPIAQNAPAGSPKKSAGLKSLIKNVTECVGKRPHLFGAGRPPVITDNAPRNSKRAEQAARAVLPATGRRK